MVEAPKYLPISTYYPLIKILLLIFNAILFSLLTFLCISDYRKRRIPAGGHAYFGIVLAGWLLFIMELGNEHATGILLHRIVAFDIVGTLAKFLLAPLVFHLFYGIERDCLAAPRIWRTSLAALYAIALTCAAGGVNALTGWILPSGWPGWQATEQAFRLVMIGGGGASGLALLMSRRPRVTPLQRSERRRLLWLCAAWVFVFTFRTVSPGVFVDVLEKLIPVLFLYVFTYYVERFTFFDILLKKGAFVFSALLALTVYFLVVPPLLWRIQFFNWSGTLVWAFSLWPIVLLAPWGHRKLSAWLDRLCLGRVYAPAEATKYFLSGLQGAIREDDLARTAEQHLSRIFRSRAEVVLGGPPPSSPAEADLMVAVITLGDACAGEIRVAPRPGRMRFQSEDQALLASLSEAFAFLLENLRLREKRLEQERREQELLLDVNRSELKALRAQINPHFLFNALNTIAGLIPRHPDRAEQTIEELAEVFRYTLSRSQREWVSLAEELEAVQAYLHIEQARFGESLQFHITSPPVGPEVRIPAMMVQTLVENAVKHGVGSLSGKRTVDLRVELTGASLRLEVRDNGPGFTEADLQPPPGGGSAYGLRNVRERLRRYFGDAARLSIGRDASEQATVVAIELPRGSRAVGAS